jgi:hypothetical protein
LRLIDLKRLKADFQEKQKAESDGEKRLMIGFQLSEAVAAIRIKTAPKDPRKIAGRNFSAQT